jgi:gamma-glutamyltranspeptidase
MNGQDKKDLNVILEQMKQADKDREQMHTDIKFIKENLFNPHKGLWAETKLNSQFRENTSKWRSTIGAGFFALMVDRIWTYFGS